MARQREEGFFVAPKAAADFTDGLNMPEADLEPEVKKVIIAEEVGELIEQGIELSLHDDAPLPPPPEPPFEPVLPPAEPPVEPVPPPANAAKLSKPFNDLFKMKGHIEL